MTGTTGTPDNRDATLALTTFYTAWQAYQGRLTAALAPLTLEQLALRAAPGLRSIGEIALHVAGCRMYWLTEFLGEDGGAALQQYARWNEVALGAPYATWDDVALAVGSDGAPTALTAAALAEGLESTWSFMAGCLARWHPADLRQSFLDVDEDGATVAVSRAEVVWHVLEHDLHHGGELSLTLGMHGIPAAFAI